MKVHITGTLMTITDPVRRARSCTKIRVHTRASGGMDLPMERASISLLMDHAIRER
jgi:hypothetical protein